MAVRPIIRFPDPLLSRAASPVENFGAALLELEKDLLDTMRAAPGIGITGPHIGVMQRITVIETDPAAGPRTFVNPEILSSGEEIASHAEGSVSMPGIIEDVTRPARIRIRYRTISGDTLEEDANGLLSICLQHEIDQLNGMFWLQRLSRLKRERAIKRFSSAARRQGR